jgi:phosphoglycolate phosphatase-like HAD superfamily hydrolase
VNSPIDDPSALRAILQQNDALLLDFDGPICSVFAGIPASIIAEQLRDVLADGGYGDLPVDVSTTHDPFDVLFYAAKLGQEEVRHVELAFRAHEVEAIETAEPTPHALNSLSAGTAPVAVSRS